jgi:hypothetical protein
MFITSSILLLINSAVFLFDAYIFSDRQFAEISMLCVIVISLWLQFDFSELSWSADRILCQ